MATSNLNGSNKSTGANRKAEISPSSQVGLDYSSLDGAIGLNWFQLDPDLESIVTRNLPPEDHAWARSKLDSLGSLIGGRIARNADIIDQNPPKLVPYDNWAQIANRIDHHPAAIDSKTALWEVGYVSGFARDEKDRGRPVPGVVLAAANYLLSQADTGMVCSLGMTSGVAGLVEAYAPLDIRGELLEGLKADSFDRGTDGSMFLTERDGGSDLGSTVKCTARDIGDGRVLINGEKWFCSNIDGAAIALLARPEGAPMGSASIGLYLVPKTKDDGTPNSYTMRRLKDKLGTRSVPTGEVVFEDAIGYALRPTEIRPGLADAPGDPTSDAGGLNRMMEMVNGSRFGVALMGLGIARRSFLEAAIWAYHRRAKGKLLIDLPLVKEQLVDCLVRLEGALAFSFECALANRYDFGGLFRRICVPAAKVSLCRLGLDNAIYAVELFGGNGYCENFGMTRLLRDAQCHTIWEGSENICRLDVLRAIRRHDSHEAIFERVGQTKNLVKSAALASPALAELSSYISAREENLRSLVKQAFDAPPEISEVLSARITDSITHLVGVSLLTEQAIETDSARKMLVALRYIRSIDPGFSNRSSMDLDQIAQVGAREIVEYQPVSADLLARAVA